MNIKTLWKLILPSMLLLVSCSSPQTSLPAIPIATEVVDDGTATLTSLEQVDDYPLYTMRYFGTYGGRSHSHEPHGLSALNMTPARTSCPATWGCSLFTTLGDGNNRLLSRNFDWHFSPALLLFTDPADGYASVSMVDIEYLGFEGDRSRNLIDLPLEERRALLDAPSLPFDGMNEMGLAIGMAAVPAQDMPYNPQKKTLDELEVIREILDHAATVDEAINILDSFNIDMGNVPLHYLIASNTGDSALVEFYQGKMVIFLNEVPWQAATNFLVAASGGESRGQCRRFDLITQRLEEAHGNLTLEAALDILDDVSQGNSGGQSDTQWSVVYDLTARSVNIVMNGGFSGRVHAFQLDSTAESPDR